VEVAADQSRWTENRASTGWRPRLREQGLWQYRELAYHLALRDIKLRYKQTAFGVAWAVLQPVLGAIVFSIVFGLLADVPSDGIAYPVFVYSGLVVWVYLSGSVSAAAESLVEHREVVTKVFFPRLLAPLASVFPGLLDFAISLIILAILMIGYSVAPSLALLTLPLWILAAVAVALGAGLWLSALNALYRDVRYTLTFGIQLWLFISPVVFPSSLVDDGWRFVFSLNPAVGVIDGFRWATIGGPGPGIEALVSLASCVLLLVSGTIYFRRVERRLADRI
jgi:lipopolysaccharide transport system permease protein